MHVSMKNELDEFLSLRKTFKEPVLHSTNVNSLITASQSEKDLHVAVQEK